jgi:hypothetical protein
MSPTMNNQKLSIPSISHLVELEVVKWYIYIRFYSAGLYVL